MTRYLDDDIKNMPEMASNLRANRVQEGVLHNKGWYLYHENAPSRRNVISAGRKLYLTCRIQVKNSDKLKGMFSKVRGQTD